MADNSTTGVDPAVWDNFVKKEDGSVYHLYNWSRVCQESLGYRTAYYWKKEKNAVKVIFPLVYEGLLARKTTPMPFSDGIQPLGKGFPNRKIKSSESLFKIILPSEKSLLRKKYYHHKTRNMVSKSERSGITSSVEEINVANFREFITLYQCTMHRLGALALPVSLFKSVWKYFQKESSFSVAKLGSRTIGILWLFSFNNKMYVWANGSDKKFLSMGANYAVYDMAIRQAQKANFKEIILGSSKNGSPQAFFKLRWGATQVPIFGEDIEASFLHKLMSPVFPYFPKHLFVMISDIAYRLL